jgi:hypothetical protein
LALECAGLDHHATILRQFNGSLAEAAAAAEAAARAAAARYAAANTTWAAAWAAEAAADFNLFAIAEWAVTDQPIEALYPAEVKP